MMGDHVAVHLIFPDRISSSTSDQILSAEEKLHASRFRFRSDAVHWAACRSALRELLGREIELPAQKLPLIFTEFGKPKLAPPHTHVHFNLSHCSDIALLAITTCGEVGVDIESLARAPELLECESSFCHRDEIKILPTAKDLRALELLRIWTAKEALLKALGTGLSHPPEAVIVHFSEETAIATSEIPLQGLEKQKIQKIDDPRLIGHCAFISAPVEARTLKILA